ncbi:hypothetical protein JCM11251_004268 [Rhodosporidiobolus azoricus]
MPVNLLDLPVELLDQIVRGVALLRYEYSESRRPKPSAMHHLAYGTNRLLRSLALPYLGRLASTDDVPTTLLLSDGGTVDSRQFATVLAEKESGLCDKIIDFAVLYPAVKRVVASFPRNYLTLPVFCFYLPGLEDGACTNSIKSLEIRRGPFGPDEHLKFIEDCAPHSYPVLETLRLIHCSNTERWSCLPEIILSVTRLEVTPPTIYGPLKNWHLDTAWSRLRHFALAVAAPTRNQVQPSLIYYTEGFKLPVSSPLTSLALSTQLPTHFTSPPHQLKDVLRTITTSFGVAALTSFSLDEYAYCRPADLVTIASTFTALKKLSLGDRMIWRGSRADLLRSLTPLTSLQLLSCRILPDLPASTFRSPATFSLAEGEEEYASPASIALEAASILPRLSRVGFSGRQSTMEWFVVSRTSDGKPERAEAVELYSFDLDRL